MALAVAFGRSSTTPPTMRARTASTPAAMAHAGSFRPSMGWTAGGSAIGGVGLGGESSATVRSMISGMGVLGRSRGGVVGPSGDRQSAYPGVCRLPTVVSPDSDTTRESMPGKPPLARTVIALVVAGGQ